MHMRPEVLPFIWGALAAGLMAALGVFAKARRPRGALVSGALVALVLSGYFLYFFRDPDRKAPADSLAIVAGADGRIARIAEIREDKYLKTDTVRISIFLSLFDVHVNRAPLAGRARFLGYFPGKRFFTFQEKSSELNQHNAILIEGPRTRCLVKQIVGPVARRVVYWPDHEREVPLEKGERIGMMKFGSRLDMYLPTSDVTVVAKVGDKVAAGVTVVAELREGKQP
jgi:phosphatidylserine decarboxylase